MAGQRRTKPTIVDAGARRARDDDDMPPGLPRPPNYWVVATRSVVHVLHVDGSPWFTIPLDHVITADRYPILIVAQVTDGHFIFHYEPGNAGTKRPDADWVVEADDQGNILRRTELPLLPSHWKPDPAWSEAVMGTSAAPLLIALSAIFNEGVGSPYTTPLVVGQGIAVLAGLVLILRLARRYNLSGAQKILWGLFCLPLGLVAVLLLMSLRERVGRMACASCGKRRVVSQEKCEYCGAPAVPAHDEGIEIFAST